MLNCFKNTEFHELGDFAYIFVISLTNSLMIFTDSSKKAYNNCFLIGYAKFCLSLTVLFLRAIKFLIAFQVLSVVLC